MTDVANNLATMASIIGGVNSVVAGYRAYASPYTFLTESERKLKRVKSKLEGLSDQRRDEIEIATRSKGPNCKCLKDLEGKLQ